MAQTDPKKKTTTRSSGTTTKTKGGGYSSSVKKVVKVQKGVIDGKSGKSGSYAFSKLPSEKGFNVKTDREFLTKSGMRLAKEAGATPSKKNAKKG